MKSAIRKGWRDSASVILLNRRVGVVPKSVRGTGAVNYDVLLQTRPSTGSFPNSAVFPGGAFDAADEGERWLQLFKSYGFVDEDFCSFHRAGTTTTALFRPNPIQRHVGLRITAIRETFEELGLLICSHEQKKNKGGLWASTVSGADVKYWQERETSCYPDIWSLYYWSNWLSPKNIPKRFDTAFFLAPLQTRPEIKSSDEVTKVEWSSPFEVLQKNIKREIELYPPQQYELTRLVHIRELKELVEFARERSGYCDDLIYPVLCKAKDGFIWLYPGDDLYPSTLDYYTDEINLKHQTVKALRGESNSLHRLEQIHVEQGKWELVTKNLKQNNHIDMGDNTFEAAVTMSKRH